MALDLSPLAPILGRSAFLWVLAAHGGVILLRDAPWRSYHAAALLVLVLSPAVVAVPRSGGADVDLSSFFAAYALGNAWIAVSGLADHLLLVRLLTRQRELSSPSSVPKAPA